METWERALLALVRETSEEKLICIYNFSDQDKVAWINEQDGTYTDLLTGVQRDAQAVEIPGLRIYLAYAHEIITSSGGYPQSAFSAQICTG